MIALIDGKNGFNKFLMVLVQSIKKIFALYLKI